MTLTLQLTASLLQPVVGIYTDRHHTPYSLVVGMGFSLIGLLLLSVAGRLGSLLLAAGLVGVGSSVFHPESSRVARMASGGRHGMAQSVFQVGGNIGSAHGPAARGVPRAAARTAEHRLVLARRAARDDRALSGRRLVSAAPARIDDPDGRIGLPSRRSGARACRGAASSCRSPCSSR